MDSDSEKQSSSAIGVESPAESQEHISSTRDAWISVVGSWLILFGSFGYLRAFGTYQDYYVRIYLAGHDPSTIAWMGSLQTTLAFTIGIVSGKVFDAGHTRPLFISGSVLFTFCLFMLSLAKEGQYYQMFLSQGLGMGLGAGILFTPSLALVSVHFATRKWRMFAMGAALTGISFGALAFPIMINHLLSRLEFGPAVRATAYVVLGCLVAGNACIRPLPHRDLGPPPDVKQFFKDMGYVYFLVGSALSLLGGFFPILFIQLYATEHGFDSNLAFFTLAIVNGLGVIGQLIGNFLADKFGIWNITIFAITCGGAFIWGMIGINNTASLVTICVLFGIAAGAIFSLCMSIPSALSKSHQEVGARVGIASAIFSPFILVSGPAQGALLSSNFDWIRPIAFSGAFVNISAVFFAIGRMYVARDKGTWRV